MATAAEVLIAIKAKDSASKALQSISKQAQTLGKVGFVAAAAGAAALGVGLKSCIDEANKSAKVTAQLDAVLKSTGGAAGVTAKAATDLAASMQKVTTYDDEAVLGAENLLLTFTKIGSDIFPRATETVLNMSTALGQDLKSSAIQLGKALQDPVLGMTALRRVGVAFSESQMEVVKQMVATGDSAGAQALILKELTTEFGGSARAAAETFGGKMQQLGNIIGDIKEKIGMALIPVLQKAAMALQGFLVDHEADIERFVKTLGEGMTKVKDAIDEVIRKLKPFWDMLDQKDKMTVFIALMGALAAGFLAVAAAAIIAFIAENAALLGIPIAVAGAIAAISLLVRNWEEVWAALQRAPTALLNWLEENWQRILIAVLGGPLSVVIMNWERIWNHAPEPVRAAMNAVAGIVEEVINFVLNRLADLLSGLDAVGGALNKFTSKIGRNIPDLSGVVETLRAGVNLQIEATVKPVVEGVAQLQQRMREFKKKAEETAAPIIGLGDDLGALGGAAGGAGPAVGAVAAAVDILEDGIISAKEALEKGIPAWAAARFETQALAKTMQDELAEQAWETQKSLIKLSDAMGESGVTAATISFWLACKDANEGALTLARALELGLTPAQAATIQSMADRTKAEQALRDSIYAVMVEMATFDAQLLGLPANVSASVERIEALGRAIGDEGLGRAALDFELAMQAVNSSFGDARVAAADFAYDLGTKVVSQLKTALGQLLGGATVETAQLQLQIDTAEYEKAVAVLKGATEEQIKAYDATIAALQAQLDIYEKEHRVLQDKATLADQTLPTEREMKDMVGQITENIRKYSGEVDTLKIATYAQAITTNYAKEQAQRFGDISKDAADYVYWSSTRIGDAADVQVSASYNLAAAAGHAAGVLWSITAPPGYQGGTSYVPATGIYTLHRGEAVLRAGEAARARSGGIGDSHDTYNVTIEARTVQEFVDVTDFFRHIQRRARAGG